MKLTGRIVDCSLDFITQNPKLTLEINEKSDFMRGIDEMRDKDLSIEIKRYRPKRSLDANAYFWVLCGKLSEKLRQDKKSIYREMIRNIGGNFEILPIKDEAVETFIDNWESGRLGWFCDIVGKSKFDGYTNICAYYGSSVYDTKQMSDLIELAVLECKSQGIETLTDDEISKMTALWR